MPDPHDQLVVDTLSLSDRFAGYFLVPAKLFIANELSLSDALVSPFPPSLTEHLKLVDQVQVALNVSIPGLIEVSVGDTFTFHDLDTGNIPVSKSLSDSMSLSDVVQQSTGNTTDLSDTISLSDALAVLATWATALTDILSLSDAVSDAVVNAGPLSESVVEAFSFFDAFQFELRPNAAALLFSDTFPFSDEVAVILHSAGTSYLRRYLNDVI